MPSVYELIDKKSKDLDDIAREQDKSSLVQEKKAKKIIELCDERLTDNQKSVIRSKKSDLVSDFAKEMGIESPRKKKKGDLQKEILENLRVGKSNGSVYLESEIHGKERHPQGESHFDSAEKRLDAIREASHHAVNRCLDNLSGYYVLESFKPQDKTTPFSTVPRMMDHHPDALLVLELIIPKSSRRLLSSSRSIVNQKAHDAVDKAIDNVLDYCVESNFLNSGSGENVFVIPSHKDRNENSKVLFEIVIPRTSYPVLSAKSDPIRIGSSD